MDRAKMCGRKYRADSSGGLRFRGLNADVDVQAENEVARATIFISCTMFLYLSSGEFPAPASPQKDACRRRRVGARSVSRAHISRPAFISLRASLTPCRFRSRPLPPTGASPPSLLLQEHFALVNHFGIDVRPEIARDRIYRLVLLLDPDGETRCHMVQVWDNACLRARFGFST